MRHSIQSRIYGVELYFACNENYSTFKERWEQSSRPPSKKTMARLVQHFRAYGNVNDLKRTGRKKALDENMVSAIGAYFSLNENLSLNSFMKNIDVGVSKTTIWRTLKNDLKWKPFRPRRVHRLLDGDERIRYWCLHNFFKIMTEQPTFINSIIWSDECSMKLNGSITTNNVVYWSSSNPHRTYQRSTNRNGVMVFAAISVLGVIGIGFFDEMGANENKRNKNSVNKESYQEMLQKHLLPGIDEVYPESERSSIYFMQDGAPSHNIPQFLNRHFGKKWIGNVKHQAPLHWPSRSPDITPMGMNATLILLKL